MSAIPRSLIVAAQLLRALLALAVLFGGACWAWTGDHTWLPILVILIAGVGVLTCDLRRARDGHTRLSLPRAGEDASWLALGGPAAWPADPPAGAGTAPSARGGSAPHPAATVDPQLRAGRAQQARVHRRRPRRGGCG